MEVAKQNWSVADKKKIKKKLLFLSSDGDLRIERLNG